MIASYVCSYTLEIFRTMAPDCNASACVVFTVNVCKCVLECYYIACGCLCGNGLEFEYRHYNKTYIYFICDTVV